MMKIGRNDETAVIFCNESKHCGFSYVRTPHEVSLLCLISFTFSILNYKTHATFRYLSNCILFRHEDVAKLTNSAKITTAASLRFLQAQPATPTCCNNISSEPKVNHEQGSDPAVCCLVLPKFLYLKACGQMGNLGFKL